MKDIFDKYYKEYDAWYDKNRFTYLSELKAIKQVLPKEGKGLEIGVGTGRFASALGIEYGIDPSENMLKLARLRGIDVKLGRGEDVPFGDSLFDYIAIIIALCFVNNPEVVIKESARVLKQNGRIIIGIVDKDSFLGQFYENKKSIFYKHSRFFSVKEVKDILANAGFSNFSYYQTIYKIPDRIDEIQEPEQGFGKGGFVIISADK